jgi:hypothetical protein
MKHPLIFLAVLLGAASASAQFPYPNPDRCVPITIGDAFNAGLSGVLNAGEKNEDWRHPVAGAQIHIDSRDVRGGGMPDGAFVKAPDAWPLEGADSLNRLAIAPAFSQELGDPSFGVSFRANHIAASQYEVNFNCNPNDFGGALVDGAWKVEVEFLPQAGDDDELQLQFTLDTFAGRITLDLVDVDLEEKFKIYISTVPSVNLNGDDIDLDFFYDYRELFDQAFIGELIDEIATVSAAAGAIAGELALVTICAFDPICALSVGTAVGIAVTAGVLAYEPELRQASADLVRQALERTTGPYMRNNGFLKKVRQEVRNQILSIQVYQGKNILQAVDAIEVPDIDHTQPFLPLEVPASCQVTP